MIVLLILLIYILGGVFIFFLFGKYAPKKLDSNIGMIICWPLVLAATIIFIPVFLIFILGYIAFKYGEYSSGNFNEKFLEYLKKAFKTDW